eukprot:GHVR01020888.1.p1 GENE.GHVR01020888.1~~GHVR01020888.1.p1  ORF type:complete len:331 (-),score=37.91 GHVR01020888.1:603-1595(-)
MRCTVCVVTQGMCLIASNYFNGEMLYDGLFKTINTAFICNNVVTSWSQNTHANDYTFIRIDLAGDTRVTFNNITDDTTMSDLIQQRGLIFVPSLNVNQLLILGYSYKYSFSTIGCGYEALGGVRTELLGGEHGTNIMVMSAEQVARRCYVCAHAIIRHDTIYFPTDKPFENIDKVHLLIDTHLHSLNRDVIINSARCFNVRAIESLNSFVNGEVTRCDELILMREKVQSLINKGTYRHNAILETIEYNIQMELNLTSLFENYAKMKSVDMVSATSACMVYDNIEHKFVNGSAKKIYSHAWNGAEFVTVEYNKNTRRYECEKGGRLLYYFR